MAIEFRDVSNRSVASKIFIEQEVANRRTSAGIMPHRIGVLGVSDNQASIELNVPKRIRSKEEAIQEHGSRSLLAQMLSAVIEVAPNVEVYGIPVPALVGTRARGGIRIEGSATKFGFFSILIGGQSLRVPVPVGTNPAVLASTIEGAVTAAVDLPVTANAIDEFCFFSAAFSGDVGNQIHIAPDERYASEEPDGLTVTYFDIGSEVTFSGGNGAATRGVGDPSIATALANLGALRITEIVSPFTTPGSLGELIQAGIERNSPSIDRMFAGFVGINSDESAYTTTRGILNSEWLTFCPVFNSQTPGYIIGSTVTGVYANAQQERIGIPMRSVILPGVLASPDTTPTHGRIDEFVRTGSSHFVTREDGRVAIGDLVTTRTKTDEGKEIGDWRFTVVHSAIQYKRWSMELVFGADPFKRAIAVPDDQITTVSHALRKSTIKAYAMALVDDWGQLAITRNVATVAANIEVEENAENPARYDILIPDDQTSGLRIVAVKLSWSVYAQ